MSRVWTGVVVATAKSMTRLQSSRQRHKTLARAANELQRSLASPVETQRGTLSFLTGRGAATASSVIRYTADEPETLRWIEERVRSTDTVWDIGAGIGLYSLYMALGGTQVVAFEPSGLNYGLLVEHVALNRLGDFVVPCCMALGGSTELGLLHFSQYDPGSSGNALGVARTQQRAHFDPVFSQGVPAITGDRFYEVFDTRSPEHLKIDVDGIEGDILRGMPKVLANVRSVLIETEGSNAERAQTVIEPPLHAAGLREETSWRELGSGQNRLFVRD
jgi:FkbM family methyltransferase